MRNLDFWPGLTYITSRRAALQSPGWSKAHRPSTALRRAEGFWRYAISLQLLIDSGISGPTTTARSAALQPNVVSTPQGDEIWLVLPRRASCRLRCKPLIPTALKNDRCP